MIEMSHSNYDMNGTNFICDYIVTFGIILNVIYVLCALEYKKYIM